MKPRPCEICGRDLKVTARRHAKTCSSRCRKALSRREAKRLDIPGLPEGTS